MRSTYQNVVEEVKNLKGIEEAVALAIERETEARDFYSSKAALMDKTQFKELYEYLANEEVKHLGYLERYRDQNELPVTSTEIPSGQSFTPEFDMGRIKGGEITLGDAGILVAALRHERKSEDFYLEVAKRVDDESLKNFFEMLAGYERSHYELIDQFLEEITSFRMQT
ncbi:ferritin family protein [Methanosarcina sp.]|jgi:erythrin-vacuolar iron transport family protein|uniref:ferritin family protein n=1 Tax=Methanosarcina sp. TaxID=2213 RepID=UPI00298802A7|nr:ferritin family protein [Methanosarcina sp.]MDW5550908.1 ferritin family protein [Methanosarcina sp.]MDW5554315.1 ferritin family protein [Methanosarcina sp.]MDW5560700.1 ferritin family protein [Methanosarcina sp.]